RNCKAVARSMPSGAANLIRLNRKRTEAVPTANSHVRDRSGIRIRYVLHNMSCTTQFDRWSILAKTRREPRLSRPSTQEASHHFGRNRAGKFLVQSLELESQLLVINTEQMHNRGVEVAHRNRITHDVIAIVVRQAVSDARFHSAAGHPDG